MMKKFTVFSRPDEISSEICRKLIEDIRPYGYVRDDDHPDIVFVIGGDGTFLYAVHQVLRNQGVDADHVRFYGIHTGTLGFYTDFKDSDYDEFVRCLVENKVWEVDFPLLQAIYGEDNKHNAINEIRIENPARTQKLDVYINGDYFETFRGTGMCVCTQLGSTAFNRSLGGAVIQEGLDLIELTEIAGLHHSKARSLFAPIVLRNDSVIEFRTDSFKGAVLGCDADVYPLDGYTSLTIRLCRTTSVRTLRGRDVYYLDRLRALF